MITNLIGFSTASRQGDALQSPLALAPSPPVGYITLGKLAAGFAVLASIVLGGCASHRWLDEGTALIEKGDYEAGLAKLEEGVRLDPRNAALRSAYARQKEVLVYRLLAQAEAARIHGKWEEAEAAYQRVLGIAPSNARALSGLDALGIARRNAGRLKEAREKIVKSNLSEAETLVRQAIQEDPYDREARRLLAQIEEQMPNQTAAPTLKAAVQTPVNLEFRDASIRQVFDILSRSAGINFIFDREVRPDLKTTIQVRNTTIEDVIRYILVTNQLQQKVLDENTLLIYPNTSAKSREYQDLVLRSFYLSNGEAKTAANLIKTVAKPKELFVDEKLNLVVVRDTLETIRVIERIIANQDLTEPEVVLEVEILEVGRDLLQELGITYPDRVDFILSGAAGPDQPLSLDELRGLNSGNILVRVPNPFLTLALRAQEGRTNLLANPKIRVKNREKARILVGDKVPVITTTTTATGLISESISYLDVGLRLEVEPTVHLANEVDIKVALEVSNIVREFESPGGSLIYRLGTRGANTVLRLKDGETQVLAGLISDEQRKSVVKVPGLGDIPGIGRLFSSQSDTTVKTEIMLLMTPRIVRNIVRPGSRNEEFHSGTEASFGAPPLLLRRVLMNEKDEGRSRDTQSAGLKLDEDSIPLSGIVLKAPSSGRIDSEFSVQVNLATVGKVRSAIVDMVFDPSRFQLVRVEEGELIKKAGEGARIQHFSSEGSGRVQLRVSASKDLTGRGELARLVFRLAGAPGTTSLGVDGVSLFDESGNVVPTNIPDLQKVTLFE